MATRTAQALWMGDLKDGKGRIQMGGGRFDQPYSFPSRFQDAGGTNPEELIAAAHAGCYSMALAHLLSLAGHSAVQIKTVARVHLDKVGEGFEISLIELDTEAKSPGLKQDEFQERAEKAKRTCPVSKALAATKIQLKAKLVE